MDEKDIIINKLKEELIQAKNQINQLETNIFEQKEEFFVIKKLQKEQNSNYYNIFHYSPIGIIYYNKFGIISECNDKFCEIIGASKDVLKGFNMMESIKDEILKEQIISSLENGLGNYKGNYKSVSSNKITPVRIIFRGIKNDNNEFVSGIGLVEDITEQQITFDNLLESNSNLETMLQMSENNIMIADENGNVKKYNANYKKTIKYIFGIDIRLNENPYNQLVDINDIKSWNYLQERVLAGEKLKEIISLKKDDELFYFEFEFSPIFENRKIKGFVELFRDITEQKKQEIQLKDAKDVAEANYETLQGILAALPDIIFIYDKEGRIIDFHTQDISKLYMKPINFLNKLPQDIFNNEFGSLVIKTIKEVFNTQKTVVYEYELPINGKFNRFEGRMVFLSDNKALSVVRDITQQKINELELLAAKEKAEENDRLKSAFLANMSHEIRTPMNGIMGFADLLITDEIKRKKSKQYVKIIYENCTQLLRIVNDIVDISKIETGQIEVYNSNFSISEMLEELLIIFQTPANYKNIDINLKNKIDINFNIIKSDKTKLQQALENLISNAIKFTQSGFVSFGCEINDNTLVFFVQDTGIGIPINDQESIFESFRQGKEDIAINFGGTGLGLSISKAYIEKLGGKIWVDSIQGKGTTFYFTIPFVSDSKNILLEPLVINNVDTNMNKILVVEDEEINYIFLEELLLMYKDISIIRAKTGKEALEIFNRNDDINLILMDIKLPDMSGLEVTKQIKNINSKIPIIAQTAYAMSSDRQNSINAGCNDYISKPINRKEFEIIIKKYITI